MSMPYKVQTMLLNPIFVVVNAQAVRNANTGQQMMQAV
jgi:hypothetical protein